MYFWGAYVVAVMSNRVEVYTLSDCHGTSQISDCRSHKATLVQRLFLPCSEYDTENIAEARIVPACEDYTMDAFNESDHLIPSQLRVLARSKIGDVFAIAIKKSSLGPCVSSLTRKDMAQFYDEDSSTSFYLAVGTTGRSFLVLNSEEGRTQRPPTLAIVDFNPAGREGASEESCFRSPCWIPSKYLPLLTVGPCFDYHESSISRVIVAGNSFGDVGLIQLSGTGSTNEGEPSEELPLGSGLQKRVNSSVSPGFSISSKQSLSQL